VALLEAELARGGPRAECFHLLALVHRAAGRTREADVALGRALYLDPEHVGALLLAAVAAEGRGESGAAARLKARARAASRGGPA
jgi:chemotaxis protein methyltransferase WspC